MSDLIAVLQNPSTLERLSATLPAHLKIERFISIAQTEINKNPELGACSPASFMSAFVQSIQLGLEPGAGLGLAFLIPFKNHKTGETLCTFIPGYKGLVKLARQSGQLRDIAAYCVYQGDDFDYALGTEKYIHHKPKGESRAVAVTYAYALADYKFGGRHIEVMPRAEIDAIRDRGRKNNVWNTDYQEMARKTVLRRICKQLDLSPECSAALAAADAADELMSSPARPEPVKYARLVSDDATDQTTKRLAREHQAAVDAFYEACRTAEAAKLDVEKIIGVTYDQAMSESADFLEAAAEKLRGHGK